MQFLENPSTISDMAIRAFEHLKTSIDTCLSLLFLSYFSTTTQIIPWDAKEPRSSHKNQKVSSYGHHYIQRTAL